MAAHVENEAEEPSPAPMGRVDRAVKLKDGLANMLMACKEMTFLRDSPISCRKNEIHVQECETGCAGMVLLLAKLRQGPLRDSVNQRLIQVLWMRIPEHNRSRGIPR